MAKDDLGDKLNGGALGRGLRVLTALNDLQSATISNLVTETQLPKPTTIRLLQTLLELGYAQHDAETGTYRVTAKVASLARGLSGRSPHEAVTREVLDALADDLKWPIEFLMMDGGSMVVEANNRERAPIKLTLFERRRFPVLASAAGIVVLSSLDAEEAETQITRLSKTTAEADAARDWIAHAREAGYAQRPLKELAENMVVSAVAVPGERAALSLVYFQDVVPRATFEITMLARLQEAAQALSLAHQAAQ